MSLPVVSPDGIIPDKDQTTNLARIGFVLCVDPLVPGKIIRSQERFRALVARVVAFQRMGLEMRIEVVLTEESFLTLITFEQTFLLLCIVLLVVGIGWIAAIAVATVKTTKRMHVVVLLVLAHVT